MAINNFVNFITDTITPPIINDYGVSCPDFCGNDSSTGDYTKLGWVFKCYLEMKDNGLVDASVTSVVQSIAGVNNISSLRSQSGFNILQILVFERRSDKEFSLNTDLGISCEDIKALSHVADNSGGQTALHMCVDYGMSTLLSELGVSGTGHIDSQDRTGDFISPWGLGIMKGAEEIVSESETTNRREVAALLSNAPAGTYSSFFGPNPLYSGGGGSVKNEISRFIMSSSHDVFKMAVSQGWILNGVDASGGNPIPAIIETADGISNGSVKVNLANYSVGEHETGYHPLFFYIYKYRNTADIATIGALASNFSPLSISIGENGETEGFNVIGLASYYMTYLEDGTPTNVALAGWIKTVLSGCGADANNIWAVSGNARDFTSSSTGNAFGAITNIISKINDMHSAWWAGQEEGSEATVHDFESTYTTMAGAILPDVFDYSFYRIWMVEFGKEIE